MSYVTSTCVICGKPFTAPNWQMKQGRRTCGNKTCATKAAWDTRGRMTVAERFWHFTDRSTGQGPKGDCWIWKGSLDPSGYGQLGGTDADNTKKAYVVSYEIHYGPVPNGLWVLHTCDNPPCVNPDHLNAGTREENAHQYKLRGALVEEISIHSLDPAALIITPEEIEAKINTVIKGSIIDVMLSKLKDRHREVIMLRFGLDGMGERTLEAVGEEMNLTRQRVQQIEAKALRCLRHPAISGELKAALAA